MITRPKLSQLIQYFLKLGTVGFGGPVVLCEHMRRDLVEKQSWVSPEEYVEGLALSQLAPGPLAAQLAMYLGWVTHGFWGATAIAFAFILPSLIIVFIIAALYLNFEGLNWLQGAFYGVGAAVIGIMAKSSHKLAINTLKNDKLLWITALFSTIVTVATESESLTIILLSGIIVVATRRTSFAKLFSTLPIWLLTGLHGFESKAKLTEIFLFFAKSGAFVFGSGLAIVPFLHSGVVMEHHWLTERQFLDAVAVAMLTPGPVVITVAFIGYLISGPIGGLVGALGVFLPCYFFVVLPAPYFSRFAKNLTLKAFVDGVTAASIGAIAGATIVLAQRALIDRTTILLALGSLLAITKSKKISEPTLIACAGVIGFILKNS